MCSQINNIFEVRTHTTKDTLTSDFRGLDLQSEADAATLMLLLQSDGLSISVLAELLELSHASTVRVADRLARRSLVRRSHSYEDAWGVQLTLTNTGRSLAGAAFAARESTRRALLSVLSTAEFRQFGDLLITVLVSATTNRIVWRIDRAERNEAICTHASCAVEPRTLQIARYRGE